MRDISAVLAAGSGMVTRIGWRALKPLDASGQTLDAEGDSRVHPAHARKMAARLQAATSCGTGRPVLLREEARAGHGQGKPVSAQADEQTDVLGFLYDQLGVDVVETR